MGQVMGYDATLASFATVEAMHVSFADVANRPDMDLRTAQACLTYLGYDTKGVDGTLGPATRAALATYRKKRGQPPGDLDAALLQILKTDAAI